MSRPPTEIDKPKLKTLMRLKPTLADTAAFFECSERTIERFIRQEFSLSFVEFREQNMVHTRLNIIRKAISMAEGGNVAMLIFCLKNVCGWKDRYESETKNETNTTVTLSAEEKKQLASDLKDDWVRYASEKKESKQ